jgi:hypothetical protein
MLIKSDLQSKLYDYTHNGSDVSYSLSYQNANLSYKWLCSVLGDKALVTESWHYNHNISVLENAHA